MVMVRFAKLVLYNDHVIVITERMTNNVRRIITRTTLTAGIFYSYPNIFRNESKPIFACQPVAKVRFSGPHRA